MATAAPVTPYQRNFHGTFPFSNTGVMILLAASTALSWTVPGVPTQLYRACFRCSSTAEAWVSLNGTATVPTSNTATATSNQEFIPAMEPKYVRGGDVLSFIAVGTPEIGVSLLLLQNYA
jgi:hypothetical protein